MHLNIIVKQLVHTQRENVIQIFELQVIFHRCIILCTYNPVRKTNILDQKSLQIHIVSGNVSYCLLSSYFSTMENLIKTYFLSNISKIKVDLMYNIHFTCMQIHLLIHMLLQVNKTKIIPSRWVGFCGVE